MIISPAKALEAASYFGIELDTLTRDELSRLYKERAKEAHPDKGGSLEAWARLSWATECLTHWLQHRPQAPSDSPISEGPKCLRCGGTGRLKVAGRRFGSPLTIMCDTCRGLGTLEPVEDDHD